MRCSNLQARLPAVVIGGGLTGVDTATELLAYYPLQVEKTLDRYEALSATIGERRGAPDPRRTRNAASSTSSSRTAGPCGPSARAPPPPARRPNFVPLVRQWGGVTLAYRKRLQDAPAYRLNHEEVAKALEEGITFAENLEPGRSGARRVRPRRVDGLQARRRPRVDAAGAHRAGGGRHRAQRHLREGASGHVLARRQGEVLQGRIASIATGPACVAWSKTPTASSPRTPATAASSATTATTIRATPATSSRRWRRPSTATRTWWRCSPNDLAALDAAGQPAREAAWQALAARFDDELLARVERVVRLTPTIIEVVVKAPAAARHFEPGQFYRLQNFERGSAAIATDGQVSSLVMEGIALTGAWVDREQGLLSLITLEMGVSSRLCAYLQPGEPVVVMGPTGTPTEIPENEAVLLAGGGLGNAVLFSIARALKARGNRVLYFAGYKNGDDLFKREDIEAATDQVIWATDSGVEIPPGASAGPPFPRQHRAGDGGLRRGPAGRHGGAAAGGHAHHRHRLRPHDGRGAGGAARRAGAAPDAPTSPSAASTRRCSA